MSDSDAFIEFEDHQLLDCSPAKAMRSHLQVLKAAITVVAGVNGRARRAPIPAVSPFSSSMLAAARRVAARVRPA
jgi:hypothetical protein